MFDHEKLDVYRLSLDFVAWAYVLAKTLKGSDRSARYQLIRASQSIPLNIAAGNGKRLCTIQKLNRRCIVIVVSQGNAILNILMGWSVIIMPFDTLQGR